MLLAQSSKRPCACRATARTGTGATTNVEDGVQYNDGAMPPVRGGAVIGALRSGGFVYARIKSNDPFRTVDERAKVSVRDSGQNVTSAHLKLASEAAAGGGNKVVLQGIAWGNGDFSATPNAGPAVSISCGTCHNPHGNGMYRILNPIPSASGLTGAAVAANVTDYLVGTPAAVPATTRNYTVIQTDAAGARIYLASDVQAIANSTAGDYWHRRVPWNSASSANDAPNGLPSSSTGFSPQITAWCSTCHTRYMNSGESGAESSTDAIFNYRHATTGSRSCTTCHVAHGSNAQMAEPSSASALYPGDSRSGASSRLLKVDNRGTCQLCHDPTNTATSDYGTTPSPVLP